MTSTLPSMDLRE
jgi:hypothetical protein